ncbi:MAG: WD40 repeat domain-containing protein [Candidatus Helarchaeota archaeon]
MQGSNYVISFYDLQKYKEIASLDLKEILGSNFQNISWAKLFNKDEYLAIRRYYSGYFTMEIWDWRRKVKLNSLRFRNQVKSFYVLFNYNRFGIIRDYSKEPYMSKIVDFINQEVIKEKEYLLGPFAPKALQNDRYVISDTLGRISISDWTNDEEILDLEISKSGYLNYFISPARDAVFWFDSPNLLKKWKINGEIVQYELKTKVRFSRGMRFFIDEKLLCGISGPRLYVYELETGELLLNKHRCFNDGQLWIDESEKTCVLGVGDVIEVRDSTSFKLLSELKRNSKPISDFKVSKDGNILVSAGDVGLVHIWNLKDRKYLKPVVVSKYGPISDSDYPILKVLKLPVGFFRRMDSFYISPEFDRFILTTDEGELIVVRIKDSLILKRAQAWDQEILKELGFSSWWENSVNSLEFFDNNSKIATLSQDRCIRVWTWPDLQLLHLIKNSHQGSGRLIMVNDRGFALIISYKDGLILWDLLNKQILYSVPVSPNSIDNCITFNNRKYLILGKGPLIKIYETASGNCTMTLHGHSDLVKSLKLFKNEKFLLSESRDDTLRVWNLQSGKCLKVLSLEAYSVYFFEPDPDGSFIYVIYYLYKNQKYNYLSVFYDGANFNEIRRTNLNEIKHAYSILYEPHFFKTKHDQKFIFSFKKNQINLFDVEYDNLFTRPVHGKSFIYGMDISYFSEIVDHYYIPELDSYAIGYVCGCIELWSPDFEFIQSLVFNIEYWEVDSSTLSDYMEEYCYKWSSRDRYEFYSRFSTLNSIALTISPDGKMIFALFDNGFIYGFLNNWVYFNISNRIFISRDTINKMGKISFTNDHKYIITKDKYSIKILEFKLGKKKLYYHLLDDKVDFITDISPILKLYYFKPDYGARLGRFPLYDKFTILIFDPVISTVWDSNFERLIKNIMEHCKLNKRVISTNQYHFKKIKRYLKWIGKKITNDMTRENVRPIHVQDLMINDFKLTPDKKYLLVRYNDSIEIWDILSGSLAYQLVDEYKIVSAFPLNNNKVFICDEAGNVFIWTYFENSQTS